MMPRLPGAQPEIPVSDVAAAADYYRDKLGFTIDWLEPDIELAGISRDECRLFLAGPRFREEFGNASRVMIWLNLHRVRVFYDFATPERERATGHAAT